MRFKWMNPMLDADGDIGAASAADTGVDTALDAGEQQVTGEQTGDTQISNEKDFAAALRAREEQLRAKLEQEYSPYKAHASNVERIAKEAGFASADDYLRAVDDQLAARKAEDDAKRLGVDPDTYNQFFQPVHTELAQTKEQLKKLQQESVERQVKAEIEQLSANPDFDSVKDQVFDIAMQKGYSLTDAYKLVTWESRVAAAKQETEQQVLAQVTGRDSKQVLSSTDKGATPNMDPSTMSLSDIEAISARVQRGERITL